MKKNELTALEAAREAQIRLDVLYPLLRVGRIPARQVDGRWLVSAAAIREYVKGRRERRLRKSGSTMLPSEGLSVEG
jgi:hypothetical protein